MVSTRKGKHQNKTLSSQLNDSLNYFVMGIATQVGVAEDKRVGPQDGGPVTKFGSSIIGANSASYCQVIDRSVANKNKRKVDSVVAAVENRFHDAILTAIDSVVQPRVEMTARSTTGSSGQGQQFRANS